MTDGSSLTVRNKGSHYAQTKKFKWLQENEWQKQIMFFFLITRVAYSDVYIYIYIYVQ